MFTSRKVDANNDRGHDSPEPVVYSLETIMALQKWLENGLDAGLGDDDCSPVAIHRIRVADKRDPEPVLLRSTGIAGFLQRLRQVMLYQVRKRNQKARRSAEKSG